MFTEKNIPKLIVTAPVVVIFILAILSSTLFMADNKSEQIHQIEDLKKIYVDYQKKAIKIELERFTDFINFKREAIHKNSRDIIKQRVEDFEKISQNIYKTYKYILHQDEIEKLIIEAVRDIRFNNQRGYYFALKSNGKLILLADKPDLEGKNVLNIQNSEGSFIFKELIDLAKKNNESFFEYNWSKPNSNTINNKKIAFIKYIKNLDLIIGTGEYLDDIETTVQEEIISRVANMKMEDDKYIFIIGSDQKFIYHPFIKSGETGLEFLKDKDKDLIKNILQDKNDTYKEYIWNEDTKTSYFKHYSDWQWIIATGFQHNSMLSQIKEIQRNVEKNVNKNTYRFMGYSTVIAFFALLISIFISNKINQIFFDYKSKVKEKTEALIKANKKSKIYIKEIEKLSTTDSLTNLRNKREFTTIFPREIQRAHRDNKTIVFSIIDIDFFKLYNDNYGHHNGDITLAAVGQVLNFSTKRANDFAFRLGGEEFGILTSNLTQEDAYAYLKMVVKRVEDLKIEHKYSSSSKYVTISVGLVVTKIEGNVTPDNLYQWADKALYNAKKDGKNRVSIFNL